MRKFRPDEEANIKILTENSVEFTAIEPTETGLGKSIMDAPASVRNYLKEKDIHNYSGQDQGTEHKILVPAFLVYPTRLKESQASLYRPTTKNGDPRIWFKGLPNYAEANDILGIIAFDNKLYVINLTKFDIDHILTVLGGSPFKDLVQEISRQSNLIANELLALLIKIAQQGPIKGLVNADTGIGRTLEHHLGIAINSSKQPDYKGIEIKSYRNERDNRKNLFAQVPDWTISKFKSSADILNAFGYWREEDFKLYCTVSAFTRNSQGLKLKVDPHKSLLTENSDQERIGDFLHWPLNLLHKRLLEKHNETFWVSANTYIIDGVEHFQFTRAEHTKKPITSQFDILLDQGLITVDHLIKKTISGRVSEKGPLFKIKPKALNLLFPPSRVYKLI